MTVYNIENLSTDLYNETKSLLNYENNTENWAKSILFLVYLIAYTWIGFIETMIFI